MSINEVAALIALAIAVFTLRGVAGQLAHAKDPIVRRIGWSFILGLVAFSGRGFFWDLGPLFFGEDWAQVVRAMGGININAVFYIPFILGCLYTARFLQLLIWQDEDPRRWPLWRVPFYPRGLCVTELLRHLRRRR
jgi:uncharacterized membrane protein YgdD (TMEM256/DUF423 family)